MKIKLISICLWLLLANFFPIQAASKRSRFTAVPSNQQLNAITFQDRSGVTETISHPERLKQFEQINFLSCQPYKQVMRVYKREANGTVRSYLTQYHDDGHPSQHVEIIDNRVNGRYWEWHTNGSLRICSTVLGGIADLGDRSKQTWIFDDNCYVWDAWGGIEAILPYHKGKLHGYAYYYHSAGQIWKTVPYEDNLVNGSEEIYYESGELLERNYYQRGVKHGPCVRYWTPNQLAAEECYEEGNLKTARYFNKAGEQIACIEEGNGQRAIYECDYLIELQSFQNGVPEGEIVQYDKQGQIALRYHIKNGAKHGEEIFYYEIPGKGHTTTPRLSINWFEGKIQGWMRSWYMDGTQESQREMTSNVKNGILTAWYTDGSLMLIEEYSMDKLTKGEYYRKDERYAISYIRDGEGLATFYDREGNFIRKITYIHGKPMLE